MMVLCVRNWDLLLRFSLLTSKQWHTVITPCGRAGLRGLESTGREAKLTGGSFPLPGPPPHSLRSLGREVRLIGGSFHLSGAEPCCTLSAEREAKLTGGSFPLPGPPPHSLRSLGREAVRRAVTYFVASQA